MTRHERVGQSIAISLDGNFGYFDVNNLALNNVIAAELYIKFVKLYAVRLGCTG